MRKTILRTTEWIHATLILAIVLPALYCLGAKQPDLIGRHLYSKCLILFFPAAATDIAARRCRGLSAYLSVCAAILAATAALGWYVGTPLRGSALFWLYFWTMIGETIFMILYHISERLTQARLKEDEAPKEAQAADESHRHIRYDSLSTPSFAVLLYFTAVYFFAVNLYNPAVCNAALFSAAVYTVIAMLHRYITETEEYLAFNKRTCNIPSRRIYAIGTGMLALFLLLFAIAILPSILTASVRHYRDIRESNARIQFDYEEFMKEYQPDPAPIDPALIMGDQQAAPLEPPEWLGTLFDIMTVIVLTAAAALLIKTVYDTFRTFRAATDDNGDIVEELESTDEAVRIKRVRTVPHKLSERERIRKEYRRFIRRYRKEHPARYESPSEIEKAAGIYDSAECRTIHQTYEEARYRREN